MARPKPEITPTPVLLRLQPDTLKHIDAMRGDIARSRWIEVLVTAHIADTLPPLAPKEVRRIMRSIKPPTSRCVIGFDAQTDEPIYG